MHPTRSQLLILAGLMLAMATTRFHHFLPIADASWALFFAGGFYLTGLARWAFPLLMLEAVAIDWFATRHLGVSSYCISPAYVFLVPTHAALWLGGRWLRAHAQHSLRGLLAFAGSVFIATALAYAISGGSFYWLSGRIAEPSFAGWGERYLQYFQHFLSVTAGYVTVIAAVDRIALALRNSRSPALH